MLRCVCVCVKIKKVDSLSIPRVRHPIKKSERRAYLDIPRDSLSSGRMVDLVRVIHLSQMRGCHVYLYRQQVDRREVWYRMLGGWGGIPPFLERAWDG